MNQHAPLPDTIVDSAPEDDRFIDTEEASKLTTIAVATLITRRNRNPGDPPFYRLANNKVAYLRSELIAWMKQFRVAGAVKIAPAKPGQAPRPWESRT